MYVSIKQWIKVQQKYGNSRQLAGPSQTWLVAFDAIQHRSLKTGMAPIRQERFWAKPE